MSWWAGYVGMPFAEDREEGGGVTCWGLVRRIYAEQLAVDLPRYGEISARDLLRVARAMDAAKNDGWNAVQAVQAYDVCLMRGPRGGAAVVHVGVMIDAQRLLHVEAATAAVVVPVTHFSVAGRILGYRRRAA